MEAKVTDYPRKSQALEDFYKNSAHFSNYLPQSTHLNRICSLHGGLVLALAPMPTPAGHGLGLFKEHRPATWR